MSNTSKKVGRGRAAPGDVAYFTMGNLAPPKTSTKVSTVADIMPAKAAVDSSPRKGLLERAKAARAAMTDEEDAAITAAAIADPDAQPVDELFRRRGRPALPAGARKLPVLLKLDPDVVERFKADGPGWQTRMNAALRKAAGLR